VHPRLFQFGHVAIPTSGVLTAIAIVAALFTARATARFLKLDPEKLWDLGIVGVLTALFAPRLVLIVSNWRDFVAHPLWLIGVVHVRSDAAVLIGVVAAIVVVCLFILLTRMPFRRTLDALAPSLALGFAIANIGAFTSGSGFGTPTSLPWAVTYTSRLASLWNGAPLGTPVHPVQVYAAIAEFCFVLLLLTMIENRDRWKTRGGEIMGAWLFLYGLSSFFLTLLRGDLAFRGFVLFESVAATMVLAGALLWLL
jgi:phosphatidylglycerol---prolipoprotein diacylglyceryl transferase